MVNIVAFAGKKCSGKNTGCNAVFGDAMRACGLVDQIKINKAGQLVVPVDNDGKIEEGILNPLTRNPLTQEYLKNNVWPVCKIYSFADPLKSFCIDVLGLTESQVYGSDEDKNSLTELKWENIPNVVSPLEASTILCDMCGHGENPENLKYSLPNINIHESGKMTSREVLQVIGTDIIRKICPQAWVQATVNKIKKEQTSLALISDLRFPNEADGVREAGGKVIHLLRAPYSDEDQHDSETALDNYKDFDWVLDNSNMTIQEQVQATINKLKELDLLPWSYNDN